MAANNTLSGGAGVIYQSKPHNSSNGRSASGYRYSHSCNASAIS